MQKKMICAAIAAAIAAWVSPASARENVNLGVPGVVGTEGQNNGVDTTGGPGPLTVGAQNININNNAGGAITTNAANTADLVFTGNSTVTGFTGTAGATFKSLTAGAAGTTINFNGAVFATTMTISGTGTVNLNGNYTGAPAFAGDGFINLGAGNNLAGAVTTATAGTGTLTLNGGSTVTGAVGGGNGVRAINLVGGNATITGAVQTLGFNLGAGTLTIAGALTTNAAATITTTFTNNLVFGNVNVTGASLINAGGITVVPTVTGVLTNGTTYRIVNAAAGTAGATVSVINNNPRYTFTGVTTTTGDVNIRLAVAPLATLVGSPAAAALAPILDVNAAPGSDLAAVQNAIAVLPNAAAINNALMQLAPGTTNLAAPLVAGQSVRLFEGMWASRMEEIQGLCCDVCEPGKPAAPANTVKCKDPQQRSNWWVKALDNKGRQGNTDNMNGYQTNTVGLMLAYDVPLSSQTRAGVGLGIANTRIDGNNASGNSKMDSYQATAYISHAPGPWFVQGALIAGVDNYKGTRSIVFPGVNRNAAADYKGQQYGAVVSAGQHFYFGPNIVTPLASLQASRVHVGSYTETGAGDINLRIAKQDYNLLQSSIGVKAERVIRAGNATFSPEVHAKWLHDFSSITPEQNATFTGGGGSFTATGIKQDRETYNVGAGITFLSCNCNNQTFTVKGLYDYKWNKSEYSSHQVSLIASIKF